ncbi:MAG: phosphoglucosamine mutase [Gammaproteobacteria bacterium]|nr:MAG: phosphoglucosamine mutase [Gammaproteobacteria bacterium]RLA50478.1 MAG: phosphoglucosamine mutase [Gammaproteobacteria bacterium]
MNKRFFGTDGIRGQVGEYPITVDFVLKLGWAAGKVFQEQGHGHILIGKDTRVSGYMFESALQAGIIAAGVDVSLLGPMPTPAIAYLTRTFRAQAGIVISASHNPFQDNGIKFFGADGFKLPDQVELDIERYLDTDIATSESIDLGRAHRVDDAAGRYVEFCKGTLPYRFTLAGVKLVVDCAHGATYHVAPDVLRELGATVIELGVQPNGVNINDKCGSTDLDLLRETVRETQADVGIALDGDGDRVLFVDHLGNIVDGDELLYIIASFRHTNGTCSGVAGTLMSNFGLEKALAELGVPFIRTRVGDRYVIAAMRENSWDLGGENSGHIVCGDLTTTGDGIVAALQVLKAMLDSDKTLFELKEGMHKLPQVLVNVPVKSSIDLEHDAVTSAVSKAEQRLAGSGRVLLRPSGTEPIIRVMVEGEDVALVDELAGDIADVVVVTHSQSAG